MRPSSVRLSSNSRSKSAAPAKSGSSPVFPGVGDFDLELLDHHTLDGRTQELVYRPTPH